MTVATNSEHSLPVSPSESKISALKIHGIFKFGDGGHDFQQTIEHV